MRRAREHESDELDRGTRTGLYLCLGILAAMLTVSGVATSGPVSPVPTRRVERPDPAERRRRPRRRLVRWLVVVGLLLAATVGTGMLMLWMPGRSHEGPLPEMNAHERALTARLGHDLQVLCGDIGERHVGVSSRLERAARFLETTLAEAGLAPRRETYDARGFEVSNVVAEIPGGEAASEIVVVGAHYDTVPGCPGANDNGTGAVATLALARAFAGTAPRRTLRFVLFVNEEPPYFQTAEMGSWVHAKGCRARGENVVAMLSLETIGLYTDAPGSQRYPFPISLFYPSTGNFVAFVGNVSSRRLVRDAIRSFRRTTAFPSEGAAVPGWIAGVGWSDHWAFWQEGYPAVMVTDTALFRDATYHTPRDDVEHVNLERFARVVGGLEHVVAGLAGVTLPVEAADG